MDRITCGLIVVRISLVLRMPITIKVVRLNPSHGEVYSIKHYVIKFVRHVITDITDILLEVALNTITLTQ